MEFSSVNFQTHKNGNLIYMLAFLFAFISSFFTMTMLTYSIPSFFYTGLKLFSVILIIFKILFYDKFKYNEIYIYILLFIVLFYNWYITNNQDLIMILFLCIGARNINERYIIKLSFFTLLFASSCIIMMSKIGIIENLLFMRDLDSKIVRQSLGTIYPTVLGSIVFFLCLQYVYLRQKISLIDALIVGGTGVLIYVLTDNRLVLVLLIILSIYSAIASIINIEKIRIYNLIKQIWLTIIFTIPIIFVYICYNYGNSSNWMIVLNRILSNRLYLSYQGFISYDITNFGQNIVQYAFGGGQELPYGVRYFYLDSLPVLLLISMGSIIFVGYLLFNYVYIKKAIESKNVHLAIILSLIVIYDLIDNKSIKISLNPFLLLSLKYIFYGKSTKTMYESNEKELN